MAGLASSGGWETWKGAPDRSWYNPKATKGLTEQWQSLTNSYGGAGDFGKVSDGEGGYINVDKAAYDATPANWDKSVNVAGGTGAGGWFGRDGYLAGGAAIAQGIGGLANAYTGYKNYQLAQDQFDAEQKYAGANLYNQGTLVNNQIKNAAEVGQSLAGDTMTADQRAAGLAGLASKYVKTAV